MSAEVVLHYEIVPPERYRDVVEFMAGDFWQDEPTCKAVGAAVGGLDDMNNCTYTGLQEGMSHMATDINTGNIAGVAVNGPAYKNEDPDEVLQSIKDKNFKKAVRLMQDLNTINLFEKYDTDEVFYVKMLSTARDYRLKGVATKLLCQGVELAKSLGYKVAKSESSGVCSQNAFSKAGYTTMNEIFYKDYVHDGEVVFKDIEKIHPSTHLVVQCL